MAQETCYQTACLTSSHSHHEDQVKKLDKRPYVSSLLIVVPIEDTNNRIGHDKRAKPALRRPTTPSVGADEPVFDDRIPGRFG
jgi:hypothetical protein